MPRLTIPTHRSKAPEASRPRPGRRPSEEHAPAVAFPIALIIAAALFGIGGAAVGWYYLSLAAPVSQPARQGELQRGADGGGPEPTVGAVQDR